MSDADATIKQIILEGLINYHHKKNCVDYEILVRNRIFDNLFNPHIKWAIEEKLQQDLSETVEHKEII